MPRVTSNFRGTLGVSKEAPVGFSAIRLRYALDTDAGDGPLGASSSSPSATASSSRRSGQPRPSKSQQRQLDLELDRWDVAISPLPARMDTTYERCATGIR